MGETSDALVEQSEVAESNLLTGPELAKMFRISVATLYRHLKYGPPETQPNSIDFRKLPYRFVGSRRFWSKRAAEKLLAAQS